MKDQKENKKEFKNLIQLVNHFSDNQTCIDYLTKLRWNGTVSCVFCNHDKVYELKGKNKRYKCSKCRKQFSPIKGTIFENSPIPLTKWFTGIYLITSHKKGISSIQLSKDLEVTQKTAWFMLHRIRYSIKTKSFNTPLSGTIECDETYVGGKEKNKHKSKKKPNTQGRNTETKTPVFGMKQRDGLLVIQPVTDVKGETLQPIIINLVKDGSTVVTDEWRSYNGLNDRYTHLRIDHSIKEFVNGTAHVNSLEGFWSLFKRGVNGIYHSVSPKHLHRYCDEYSFRYNTREMGEMERFDNTLLSTSCRLTWKDLTVIDRKC